MQASWDTNGAGETTRLCASGEIEVIGYEVPLTASKKSVEELTAHRTLYAGSPHSSAVLSGYGTAVEPHGGHTRARLIGSSRAMLVTTSRPMKTWRRLRHGAPAVAEVYFLSICPCPSGS
jgi:hypothetical protein